MIYTDKTRLAIKIAFNAHEGQFDRSGIPYILHPLHVAEQMTDEDTTVVALLHDVVEDTSITIDDLRKYGFNEKVLEAIYLLTHKDGVAYLDYVRALGINPIARKVKIEDVKHNSDVTRLVNPNDKAYKKMPLYQEALRILREMDKDGHKM